MEAKIGADTKVIQDKMDDGQKEIKAQMGSLSSRIDVNLEEMKTMLDACLGKMEVHPVELQSEWEHQEVPEEEAPVKYFGALRNSMGIYL
jgi:hypothetical protein